MIRVKKIVCEREKMFVTKIAEMVEYVLDRVENSLDMEKTLVTSLFLFSHNVFYRQLSKIHETGLFVKGWVLN